MSQRIPTASRQPTSAAPTARSATPGHLTLRPSHAARTIAATAPVGRDAAPPSGRERPDGERRPRRQLTWLVGGPVLSALTFLALGGADMGTDARTTAGIAVLMAVWWMGEALPLAVTALLPIVVFPMTGVLESGEATAPYAAEIVFLFMGGFVIALALEACGLHRRLALRVLAIVGVRPKRLLLGVMLTTAMVSMWVSNTAAALMMLPIATSILDVALDRHDRGSVAARFRERLLLSVAYAATIGGLATLIGSPPTLVMAGYVQETYGLTIGFADWMMIGVPLAGVFLLVAWLHLGRGPLPDMDSAGAEVIAKDRRRLGRLSSQERTVAVVFTVTVVLWVGRGLLARFLPVLDVMTDTTVAIVAAIVLIGLPIPGTGRPVLSWSSVTKDLPWGVLLLFGGGLSLARAIGTSGLDAWIGDQVAGIASLPTVVLVGLVCLLILLLTEMTSNTATAATFVPVIAGLAIARGLDPLLLLVPAAFAATCAFMLPVGTPPNAIVYGSEHVGMATMVRAGLALNLVGVLLITAFSMTLTPMLMATA